MSNFENDILGFDPSQLDIYAQHDAPKSAGNQMVYRTRPADSKSEDGVYRATIKPVYNPFNIKGSVLELQSYAIQDENGWLVLPSSLTNNDTSCPIFKAWKKCHFAEKGSALWKQAAKKDEGGKGLFDKRFARYITVQIVEDDNQPDLVGKYMFWKLPKSIWDLMNGKMAPKPESKKPRIPVMDFLFGRNIEIEVTPGPDDPAHPERKQRETSYSGEISEDVVSCTNPDGSPLLNDEEQAVLDKYIAGMKEVWKEKNPEVRAEKEALVAADPNTATLKGIYSKVIEVIKGFCPNITEELGYKPWTEEQTARVNAWIEKVLNLQDPSEKLPDTVPTAAVTSTPTSGITPTSTPTPTANAFPDPTDDLPF